MARRSPGLAKLKREYDALLREEEARGILPDERKLLAGLK